ncbi:flagellar filament capping protein FliD [Pseudoduganella sp. UC29_106]|uniref:flagellar filament capping protein FliD n=1 Tax=Pseudoduganella sp. UC29_106 TaxID=3374553 RepID=UPI0037583AC4
MNNVSNLLNATYGNTGAAGLSTSLSPTVAARVEQALASQKGVVNKLNTSLASSQARLSGLGQLQSALSVFQGIADSLAGTGLSTSASVSTKGVLGAATSASAKAGTYKIEVSQLAQGQILNGAVLASADTKVGTGGAAAIKVGDKTITIDSRNDTLSGIVGALKDAGLDASVVKAGTGYALQVRSASGEANSLKFSVTGDAGVKNLFNNLTQSQAAQDAVLTVDGKEVRSADNAVESVIPGVTLNLQGKGKADVAISTDSAQIAKNVSAFVAGFNALGDKLAALQKGDLKGDTALNQAASQLEQLVRTGGGTSAAKLAEAGLTFEGGKLQLDEKKLNAAVAADPEGVAKLFTNEGRGIADQLDKKIDALTGSSGVIRREATQVGKEVASLNSKKTQLAQALTVQAQALAQLYTQEEAQGSDSGLLGLPGYTGGARSLFDFFA